MRAITTSVVGGGAVRGTDDGMDAAGCSGNPNCCRTRRFTISELSTPQFWQMNLTGARDISGVTSNAYLIPHEH